jgi:hypothetical protein
MEMKKYDHEDPATQHTSAKRWDVTHVDGLMMRDKTMIEAPVEVL